MAVKRKLHQIHLCSGFKLLVSDPCDEMHMSSYILVWSVLPLYISDHPTCTFCQFLGPFGFSRYHYHLCFLLLESSHHSLVLCLI